MRKNKKEFGITLVALIITIIILLLLAGITIGQLVENGIFESTKTAKEQYENAQKEENDKILELANAIENQGVQSSSREDNVVLTQTQYNQLIQRITALENEKEYHAGDSITYGEIQLAGYADNSGNGHFVVYLPKNVGNDVESITVTIGNAQFWIGGTKYSYSDNLIKSIRGDLQGENYADIIIEFKETPTNKGHAFGIDADDLVITFNGASE